MLNAQHLKMVQFLTLTEVLFTVIHSSVLILLEKAKMMQPYEETCYLLTQSEIRFRFT